MVVIGRKGSAAYLAHELSGPAVISIKIWLRSIAGRASTILRDIAFLAAAYRLNDLAVLPGIVVVEIFPIPILMIEDDLWKLIDLEFLIFGRMGVIEGPLP